MVATSSTIVQRSTTANDVMAQNDKNNGKKSKKDILEELDNLLGYIDEDNALPEFFSDTHTLENQDMENSVPTLTTIAEENEIHRNLTQIESPSQPGLFSERLEKIKKKAFDSDQSKSKADEFTDSLKESKAANEDNVPTLSNEASPVTSDVDRLVDMFVREQMPLLEAKLRTRLKQLLKNDRD